MSRCLLIAPFLLLASGCSKAPVIVQTPPLQANLAQPCPQLPGVPVPLIDPPRLQWEADVLNAYADCAARHLATVKAWPNGESK